MWSREKVLILPGIEFRPLGSYTNCAIPATPATLAVPYVALQFRAYKIAGNELEIEQLGWKHLVFTFIKMNVAL
jgi:hypothetical protein